MGIGTASQEQENNVHPGSGAANDSPCGAHDPMRGKHRGAGLNYMSNIIVNDTTAITNDMKSGRRSTPFT